MEQFTRSRYHIIPQSKFGEKLSKFFPIPQRYILAFMALMAIVNAYTMRVSLSHAITVLVLPNNKSRGSDDYCPDTGSLNAGHRQYGNRDWSEALQGFILASFYIGYVITHIPGGILADKFGGKWVLSLGILCTAFFTVLTPLAINVTGAPGLIVLRILMGIGEGTTFPSLSVLVACWVPKRERGKLGSMVFSGTLLGTMISNSCSGVILEKYDWPILFYIFGIAAAIWFVFFTVLCYSYPGTHPFIKEKEREYLLKEIGNLSRRKKPPTPWKRILRNKPVLAMVVAQIGHDWGFFVMVTNLPKYMADVMRFSIKANGLYTTLPYFAMWISSLLNGALADFLITRKYMSTTNVRKVMTFTAALGPGAFMVGASYAGCNQVLVIALFTLSMASMGPYYAGMKLGPLDMSPNYSGFLMALTNGIAALTGIASPSVAGLLTPNATLGEWRVVFWVAFAALVSTGIVYLIWASGEVQDFDAVGDVDLAAPEVPPEKEQTGKKK